MSKLNRATVKHSPAISQFSGRGYEKIEYIPAERPGLTARAVVKKCLAQPGFLAESKRVLFGRFKESRFTGDISLARER